MDSEYIKHMRVAAHFLLALMPLIASQSAIASVQKLDDNDQRIYEPRRDIFVDVVRVTVNDGKTVVMANTPVGYWTQGFSCPYGDSPNGYFASGTVIFQTPDEGSYYKIEGGLKHEMDIPISERYLDWRATGLTEGSKFYLICPPRDELNITQYIGIDGVDKSGKIPEPRCFTRDGVEKCYVLSLDFKRKLYDEGWVTEHSVSGHADLARRYNKRFTGNAGNESNSRVEHGASLGGRPIFGAILLSIGVFGVLVFPKK